MFPDFLRASISPRSAPIWPWRSSRPAELGMALAQRRGTKCQPVSLVLTLGAVDLDVMRRLASFLAEAMRNRDDERLRHCRVFPYYTSRFSGSVPGAQVVLGSSFFHSGITLSEDQSWLSMRALAM
jgi:hypothetical protein